MARRRRSRNTNVSRGREVHTPSLTELPLSVYEDRRAFHPEQDHRPAGVFVFREARQIVPTRPRATIAKTVAELLPHGLEFNQAENVLLCVRRKRRREVLFAKRKFGRNGGRRYRRNKWSSISCSH